MCVKWITFFSFALCMVAGLAIAEPRADSEPIVVAQANAPAATRKASDTGLPLEGISESEMRRRINAWVVGVAAGKLEGAPIRLVEEMSRVLDDGDQMQILPIITRGPSYNVHALLYLRGIDLAVINGDVLDYFGKQQNISNINQRINYITQLFHSELHVLARPEIKSIEDLAGKPVNFNTKGTSAAFTGPIIFDRLGIKVKKTFIPHPVAMQQMKKSDKFAAVVFVTAKPVRPLVKKKWPEGFRLLSAPYSDKLSDFYLPARLDSKDYPDLIEEGESVETIAVPTVLAAFNWSPGHERHRKVARFVDYLFERFDRLLKEPFHPKWKGVNLAATIPGWNRLPAVQAKLDERKAAIDLAAARSQAERAAPGNPAEQERLFKEFLQWYSQRAAR
jgi:TRAP-type uncharacterized transport system substrate-binding protein